MAAALRERGLLGRAMTSTMEIRSIEFLASVEPELRRGWTLPKVGRDWTRNRLARPLVAAGLATMRARLPALIRRHAPRLGVASIWLYHPLTSPATVAAAHETGAKLVCWTVDDAARIEALLALGADGICTNDPRLFASITSNVRESRL